MNNSGGDLLTALLCLIVLAAGVGLLVSLPAFIVASAIGFGSRLCGKKSAEDPSLDADITEVKKDLEKAVKEYNITNEVAKSQILEELLAKKNLMFDEKTNTFKRRTI